MLTFSFRKGIRFAILSCLAPLLVLLISCDNSVLNSREKGEGGQDSSIPVSVESGEARFNVSRDSVKSKLVVELHKYGEVVNGNNVSSLDSVWAIGGKNAKYMAGMVSKSDSTCKTYAVGVEKSIYPENKYNDCDEVIHKCTGDWCSSCYFTIGEDGNINGCQCDSFFGHCNHSLKCRIEVE